MTRGTPLLVMIAYTGFERPHRIDSRSVMAGATTQGHVRCNPTPTGTRFSWDWTVRLTGLARLAGPLVGVLGRRRERTIWSSLKWFLEDTDGRESSR